MRCLKSEFKDRQFPCLAGELFEKEKIFRDYNHSLETTVQSYNRLKLKTQEVEFNLISHELKEIDKKLEVAEGGLNWNSEGKFKLCNILLGLIFFTTLADLGRLL